MAVKEREQGERARPKGMLSRAPLLSKTRRALKKGWYAIGPGFITGASDDDPSGIATYSQTGAHYGFGLLWTAVWQLPLLYYTQEAVARIGAVRGKGLASAIRDRYGLPLAVVVVTLVVVADTVNAGADIGAVAGSAHLVVPISNTALIVLVTSLVLGLVMFVGYRRYANVLKVLGLFLLAYLVTAFAVSEPWGEILKRSFIPHIELTTTFLFLIV
ncbi:MAG: divalent metal cation transporter, partial [Acidimicrobiia bacterium]|nr:divalent metal cation transporter [Acidimicrobiia bacterium]